MKNRTLILLAAFVVLGGLTFWFLNRNDKTTKNLEVPEMRFKQNPESVYKIFIADRTGNKTTLERKETYWLYNGKYKANPNIMDNLLRIIGGMRMQFIPTKASIPNIVKDLATIGIKVELYDKNNDLLTAYYVGGMTNNEYGTYMIKEGSDQPYVMELPSLQGGLRGLFTLKGDQWRDKSIFSEDSKKINFVSVEYPKQRGNSFKIEKKGEDYEVTPFYDLTPKIKKPKLDGYVESYLLGFEKVIAENFENQYEKKDSIRALLPFSIVTMRNDEGVEKVVRYFPIDADRRDDITGQPIPIQRYHADINNGEDFVLVQDRLTDKLFWSYISFFEK